LEKAGLTYRVVFASADYEARLAAVKARVGLMTAPLRRVPESLVVAKEYYLPSLEPMPAGILLRPERRDIKGHQVVAALRSLMPAPMPSTSKLASKTVPISIPQSKSIGHR
jgi:hypothetical protein